MRVAIYARVSTSEQDADNQLTQLRAWCVAAGHAVVAEFIDHGISGAKGADKRPRLSEMLLAAHRREFDILLVWAIDRLTREGMVKTVGYLQQLSAAGVAFHSYTEPVLCSDNEMVRDILLAVMASLARAERQKISERTKAGLDRVRAHGSKSGRAIGRPTIDSHIRNRIQQIANERRSITPNAISKMLKCDPKIVKKYLAGTSQ